jgi:tetratricopeptide (TPR) repeat protein
MYFGDISIENTLKYQLTMKKLLLIIPILFITSLLVAQADSADMFLKKGILEKEKGRRMESLKNFEKAYKYNNSNKVIISELASAYFDLRKYTQSLEKYKQLESMGEVSSSLYKQLLELSFNMKKYDDVILYATKLKQLDKSEKVNYYIGKAHYETENYGQAIEVLNEAMKEDPKNGEIAYMIARCYGDMMNYKQSVSYFEKAVSLDPSKYSWYYELGLICYGMNDDKNALKYILLAGEKGYPKDNDYMENLGIAYLNSGNLTEGVKIMSEVLKRKPSDMNILNMVAEAYYYAGKYKEAIDYWDQCLYYDKKNASALYMIGMSYQKKGEKEKGVALCDKAIEMDPSLQSLKQKKSMPGM